MNKVDKNFYPVRSRSPRGGRSRAFGLLRRSFSEASRAASNGVKIIIGLGNPDKEYENTYHNVGILFINQILNIKNQNDKSKFKKTNYFEYLNIDGLIFIKPLTFMNESGKAVKEAMKYFSRNKKVRPEEILIAHDDSDIELGKYKLDFGRSSAGHKGVESIISSLKTKSFWRLRLGVRTKEKIKARAKAGEFVLKKLTPFDQKKIKEVFEKINLSHEDTS